MRAVVILATVLECADRAYGGRLQWVSEILNEVLLFSSLLALAGIVLAGRKHVVRLNRRRFRPRLKAFGLRGRSASGTHCGVARCC
jgi:hypothetical protein